MKLPGHQPSFNGPWSLYSRTCLVCVYLNNILSAKSTQEHLMNLEEVLSRLEEAGLGLKKEKCAFPLLEVEYLGHKIDRDGLQLTETKVRAVAEALEPQRVDELRSFLGLVNSYGKFLHNLASMAAPCISYCKRMLPGLWGRSRELPSKRTYFSRRTCWCTSISWMFKPHQCQRRQYS